MHSLRPLAAPAAAMALLPVLILLSRTVGATRDERAPEAALWFRLRHQGGYHLNIRLLKGSRQDVLDAAAHWTSSTA